MRQNLPAAYESGISRCSIPLRVPSFRPVLLPALHEETGVVLEVVLALLGVHVSDKLLLFVLIIFVFVLFMFWVSRFLFSWNPLCSSRRIGDAKRTRSSHRISSLMICDHHGTSTTSPR